MVAPCMCEGKYKFVWNCMVFYYPSTYTGQKPEVVFRLWLGAGPCHNQRG